VKAIIIIPAFNEAEGIASLTKSIQRELPGIDILCVNDGSADDTAARALSAGVLCITHPFNMGIGAAVRTGMEYARLHGYDIAVRVDGDGQHPAHQITRILGPVEAGACDMAVGSRYLDSEGFKSGALRQWGSRVFKLLLRLIIGETITDPTSGFFCANRAVIAALAHYYPREYPEIESVVLLKRAGFSLREVAVHMAPRIWGASSITPLRSFLYMATVIFAVALEPFKKNPYVRRDQW